MQVTLEKTNDLDATIKVEVVEADYAKKVDRDLRELGRTRQIPGFRKGHVSIEHLRRLFGRDVKSHVLNDVVFQAVIEYLRENKIDILGEPLPKKVESIDMAQKDYTFEYEVGLAPEINVEVNKDIKVPFYTIEVSKEMPKNRTRPCAIASAPRCPARKWRRPPSSRVPSCSLTPKGTS